MRTRLTALPLAMALALAAEARGIEGVWMVTGGPGARGDCMSEFALQWDPRWDPNSSQYGSKHPAFGTSGNAGRIAPGQVCQDGDGCDRDVEVFGHDVPGQCTFKVGVCFCVNDPATDNCTDMNETRGLWCSAPRTSGQGSLAPFAYQLISPSRLAKTSRDRKARCKLEQAIRGCATNLAGRIPSKKKKAEAMLLQNNDCCGPTGDEDCSAYSPCPDAEPSPMMPEHPSDWTSQDTLRTLYPDESLDATTSAKGLINKTVFKLAPSTDDRHTFKSPLHVGADLVRYRDVPEVKDPLEQFVEMLNYDPSVHTCSELVDVQVPVGGKRQSTLIIKGTWWAGGNAIGPVDRGGGDELRLTCVSGSAPAP